MEKSCIAEDWLHPGDYLMIDGQGAPSGAVFEDSIGALYSVAFTIKMTRKFAGLGDYVVSKLEGLWYTEDGRDDFTAIPQEQWCWTLMIRTPTCVKQEDLDRAVETLLKKGKAAKVKEIRIETIREGRCVQTLHIGPYDKVSESILNMQEFVEMKGLTFTGNHHEIYLSDPRRIPPEKLKIIVRRPVQ